MVWPEAYLDNVCSGFFWLLILCYDVEQILKIIYSQVCGSDPTHFVWHLLTVIHKFEITLMIFWCKADLECQCKAFMGKFMHMLNTEVSLFFWPEACIVSLCL